MIYTLTLNPAVDMNVSSARMEPGLVNRTYDTVYTPNGKGVNVSFTLQHFGVPSVVMGPFGGFTGDYITGECRNRGLQVLPSPIAGTNRVNMFVTVGDKEYKLVNEGPVVSAQEQEALLSLLESLEDLEVLTINGSMARGFGPDYLLRIMEICNRKGAKVVPDISAPVLKEVLTQGPFLIKPNRAELEGLAGKVLGKTREIMRSAKDLQAQGARNVLVSLGGDGALLLDESGKFHRIGVPKGELKTSVGSGDSMVAGFLAGYQKTGDYVTALRTGAACGSASAFSTALATREEVESMYHELELMEVK